jgi:hypothetical protein
VRRFGRVLATIIFDEHLRFGRVLATSTTKPVEGVSCNWCGAWQPLYAEYVAVHRNLDDAATVTVAEDISDSISITSEASTARHGPLNDATDLGTHQNIAWPRVSFLEVAAAGEARCVSWHHYELLVGHEGAIDSHSGGMFAPMSR